MNICILQQSVPGQTCDIRRYHSWNSPFPHAPRPQGRKGGEGSESDRSVCPLKSREKYRSDKRRRLDHTPSLEEEPPHPDRYTLYLQSSISRSSL